jgi:hypothetical protein
MSLGNSSVHQEGEIPEITKLPNGRIRVVRRFVKFTREDVDNVQLGTLLGDFGDLDTTDEQIPNQGYTNCRLIEVEVEKSTTRSSGTDSSSFVLVQTYETLTSSFVEITDPSIEYGENGLKKVTRVFRAVSGTTSINVVGSSTFVSGATTTYLASSLIDDNTAFAELTEVYLEAGTLSEALDNVGSQKAKVIETIGTDPATPDGYSLASKQESNFEGFQTNRFTFLKDNVKLSQSEDKVGSQLAISQQWFHPDADKTVADYSLASKSTSDFEGIETVEFRFLKDNVVLSVSEDKVGSQNAVVNEVFNPTIEAIAGINTDGTTLTGYSEANRAESDYEGIKTIRVQFLKDDVELSRSEDKVGSQLAITTQIFNPTSDPTETDYSLARTEVSDVDGIPTKSFTLLKDDVELSRSEDLVGSQLAIVTQVFNPTEDPTEEGYSLASTEESDVDGIPTERFTFLKDNVILSESEDKVGSQLAITQEVFNGTPATPSGYSIASTQESDVDGIPTKRFTFLKNNVVLSESEDKVGSQLAIVKEVFNGTPTTPAGYLLANTQKSDVGGIPTRRYTFLKPSVLSKSTDNVGSQMAKVIETFSEIPVTPANYSLANTQVSDFEGIETNRYTFLKDNVELSRSEDNVGSQLAIITEVFNPTEDPDETDYSLAKTEVSDVDGIPTKRFTFLKPSILSLQQDLVGGATTIQVSAFGMTEDEVDTDLSEVTTSHILISQSEGDFEGIKTSQFTYEVDDFEVEFQAEDGMEIIVRTQLSITDFSAGVIGVDTYKTLFLTQESIDNGNTIRKRDSRYSEAGVLSISPLEEDGFSLAPSYVYVTTGAPASSMDGLVKPNGNALGTSVTWFEPKVQNVEGFSTYTQQVLSVALTTTAKVHSAHKFFTVTEPGVMSTGGAYNSEEKSGAATRYPEATQQPRTYRKKATVDVYLTSSNLITETEVAFTELGVDWCSIGFDSFYTSEKESTASVSSSWRSFPQYLNSSGTTNTSNASTLGEYYAEANSYGAGATTYTMTGIYRVELEKYTRAVNGTQLYLKTIVTF